MTAIRPAGLLSNRYPLEDMPDLTGRVAIVVGGSRGIGEAVVHALSQRNAQGGLDPLLVLTLAGMC